jgi:hypothetical protein
MKYKLFLAAVLTMILLPLISTKAYADVSPPIYSGSQIQTEENTEIELDEEILNIDINDGCEFAGKNKSLRKYESSECNYFDVEAIFYFNNPTGETVSQEVFFPFPTGVMGGPIDEDYYAVMKEEKPSIFNSYSQKVNGEEVSWEPDFLSEEEFEQMMDEISSGENDDLNLYSLTYVSEYRFKPGENKVVIRYRTPISYSYAGGYYHIHYILRTGGNWAGPIGELTTNMNFNSEIHEKRYSSNYDYAIVDKNSLQYKATNIEPEKDIKVSFIPREVWEVAKPVILNDDYQLSDQETLTVLDTIAVYANNKGLMPDVSMYGEDTGNLIVPVYWVLYPYIEENSTEIIENYDGNSYITSYAVEEYIAESKVGEYRKKAHELDLWNDSGYETCQNYSEKTQDFAQENYDYLSKHVPDKKYLYEVSDQVLDCYSLRSNSDSVAVAKNDSSDMKEQNKDSEKKECSSELLCTDWLPIVGGLIVGLTVSLIGIGYVKQEEIRNLVQKYRRSK